MRLKQCGALPPHAFRPVRTLFPTVLSPPFSSLPLFAATPPPRAGSSPPPLLLLTSLSTNWQKRHHHSVLPALAPWLASTSKQRLCPAFPHVPPSAISPEHLRAEPTGQCFYCAQVHNTTRVRVCALTPVPSSYCCPAVFIERRTLRGSRERPAARGARTPKPARWKAAVTRPADSAGQGRQYARKASDAQRPWLRTVSGVAPPSKRSVAPPARRLCDVNRPGQANVCATRFTHAFHFWAVRY